MTKKGLKDDAAEHNRKVHELKKEEAARLKEQQKQIAKYTKGLPKDRTVLIAETRAMVQTTGQFLWETGRRLVALRVMCEHGEWGDLLEDIGMSPTTAWRAMKAVKTIPESELKRLGRTHAYDVMGEPTKADQEMIDKLDSGEITPEDLVRTSDVDIKKMLKEKMKLEEKFEAEREKAQDLQAEVDALKLGTIDDRAIRERLAGFQDSFEEFFTWAMKLKKGISENSQADVGAAMQWISHQLLLSEVLLADRFPDCDTYSGPDRARIAEQNEKSGKIGTRVTKGGER